MWDKKIVSGAAILASMAFIASFPTAALSEQPQFFNFDGELVDSSNIPLSSPQNIIFRIYNPAEDCLLFEVSQSVTLDSTGAFSTKIGPNFGTRNTAADGGAQWKTIFQNAGQVRSAGSSCSSGYTPAAGHSRILRITVGSTLLAPGYVMSSVPMATVAESLQGKVPSDFILNSGASTLSVAEMKVTNGPYAAGFKAPTLSSNMVWRLPAADGANGQILGTDGAGNLSWRTDATSGGAITSLNGLTDSTQSFAVSSSGLDTFWDSSAGTHLLHIPNAADAGVVRGLISKAQYDTFNSKMSATNNLSDLTNVATARTNLGLSSMATEAPNAYVRADGSVMMTGSLDMNNMTIMNVPAPGSTSQVANKAYVDSAVVSAPLNAQPNGTPSAPPFRFTSGANTGMFSPGTYTLGFSTNGAERMRITNAGNVGIGTTSPISPLHIEGNLNSMINTTISNQNSGPMAQVGIEFDVFGYYGKMGMTSNAFSPVGVIGPSTMYMQNENNGGVALAAINGGPIRFGADSTATPTERMRITPTGKVGIGTTAPVAMLDVAGTIRMIKSASAPQTCSPSIDGVMAMTSAYRLCVCNSTAWVFTSDGNACTW